MFGIFAWFREVAVGRFDQRIFGSVSELTPERVVAGSGRGIALDCAFAEILVFFDWVVMLRIGHFPIMNYFGPQNQIGYNNCQGAVLKDQFGAARKENA
jgi:hypothetical protein